MLRINYGIKNTFNWHHIPVRRNLPQPRQPGIFHRDIWIKTTSYSLLNQCRPLFLEQGDLSLTQIYQPVNLGGLFVEISGNMALFIGWGNCKTSILNAFLVEKLCPINILLTVAPKIIGQRVIKKTKIYFWRWMEACNSFICIEVNTSKRNFSNGKLKTI